MNKIFVRFCVLQGAYWSFYASMPGYLSAYLLDCGISPAVLGGLLAGFMLCSFLGALFWGRWVDKHQASRKYFLAGNMAAAVLSTALFFFARTPAVFVLYPLLGFMIGPLATTLDAWIIASFPHRGDAQGRSRSFATLSYAVVMLVLGQLITRFGYVVMPYAALFFLAVSITVAFLQPEPIRAMKVKEERASPFQLLSAKPYLLLVAMVFFTGMAVAPLNNMKVLVFESVGGDVSFLGWDSFIGCMIQAPFLFISGKLRHIKAEKRLVVGAAAPLLYALLITLAQNPAMVIAGTICQNISFGVLFPTMREITERNVSPTLRTTAHSVTDVAYGSLSGMIASAWSGAVIQNAGTPVMGAVCMTFQATALFFCTAILLRGRKSVEEKGVKVRKAAGV